MGIALQTSPPNPLYTDTRRPARTRNNRPPGPYYIYRTGKQTTVPTDNDPIRVHNEMAL